MRRTYHYDEALGRMVEGPGRPRSEGRPDRSSAIQRRST